MAIEVLPADYRADQFAVGALVATGSGWQGINTGSPSGSGERPLDLLGRTSPIGFSADGQTVLVREYREVGAGVYIRGTDGSPAVPLGLYAPLCLSPDAARAVVYNERDLSKLILPTGAGTPQEIAIDEAHRPDPFSLCAWSRDGRRLFMPLGFREGRQVARIYVRDGESPWRAVTPAGLIGPFVVSPQGDRVATRDVAGMVTVYPVYAGAPRRLDGEYGIPVHWSSDGRWLFLRSVSSFPAHVYRRELSSGRIEPWRNLAPADRAGVFAVFNPILVAADEGTYVYGYARGINDLYLVRGLR